MRAFVARFGLCLLFAVPLILGIGTPVLARQPGQVISADQFWQRVDQTIAELDRLKTQPAASVPAALDDLANQWAGVDAIQQADGSSALIDTGPLVNQLRQRPPDLVELHNVFSALRQAHQARLTRSFGSAELAALQAVLKRPEFQWNQPVSPLQAFLDSLRQKPIEWLNSLFGQNGVSIPIPGGEIFFIFAIIVLIIVLAYVFRSLFGDLIVESRLNEDQLPGDELLTAETALQRAKEISQTGDYRTAVRYLYLSSLLLLDERGLLRFDRSKTNREYLRSVASYPHLSEPLREVIDVFDRVWYGFRTLDEYEFRHYVEKVDQLREQKK